MTVTVIGAGLAGCEAAWQIAKKGIKVKLYEMKPQKYTPAHTDNNFAELVCSNSFRANSLENAAGLLKEELRILDSIIIKTADETVVPAGGALAVDRQIFSELVTKKIRENKNIEIINEEVTHIPEDEYVIIASGPLTSKELSKDIKRVAGDNELFFFDAAAPIVTYDSINEDKVFKASRYDKGEADYINCPMTKEEYDIFYNELVNAQTAQLHEFENNNVFEGCMPVEVMAKRGRDTLLFGPLKPVGLFHPVTKQQYHAVVQLRQDNIEGTLYNLVGFQTHLKWGEQKRVFGLIPGLENADFVRYGVMHRNTYINSPQLLNSIYQLKKNKKIFFAGQITGVEGYIESTASGCLAGINIARIASGKDPLTFPQETATGALAHYISTCIGNFQPMNVNFGIIAPLSEKIRNKKEKKLRVSQRAIEYIQKIAKGSL